MAKGKGKRTLLGIQGIVGHRTAPFWGFLYDASLVKDSNYNVGDVVELPNGKAFVYCKSGGPCYTALGNILWNAIGITGIDYANNVAEDAAIGDTSVLITNGAAIAQTLDGLRGGSILLKQLTGSDDSALQIRGIVGNTACAASGTTRIYLDAPLTGALTTNSYSYCMPSPYSDVRYNDVESAASRSSHVGVAATYVSAANMYHWEQFRGRVIGMSLNDNPGTAGDANKRELVWRYQGSLQYRGATGNPGREQQIAGYIMDSNRGDNGATEVMLTGHV